MDYKIILTSSIGVYQIPEFEFPEGWEDFTIILSRHKTFHGVFPNIDCQLTFHSGASKYIKSCYEALGLDLKIRVYVTLDLPNGVVYRVFDGIIDVETITFKPFKDSTGNIYYLTDCNLKSSNCTQLFLERIDADFNIYLNPAFNITTFDGTELHTRYKYVPYEVYFPSVATPSFAFVEIDRGCTTGLSQKNLTDVCGTPNLSDTFGCPANNFNPDYPDVRTLGLPYNSTLTAGSGFFNKTVQQCITPTMRYKISNDYNEVDLFSYRDWYSQTQQAFPTYHFNEFYTNCYDCCPSAPPLYKASCSCAEYKIVIDMDLFYGLYEYRNVISPGFYWQTISADFSLEIRFGQYTQSIPIAVGVSVTNPPPLNNFNYFHAYQFNNGGVPYTIILKPDPCLVNIGDELEIWVRSTVYTELVSLLLYPTLGYASGYVGWRKLDVKVIETCRKEDSGEWCIPIHEAFTVLTEHYTNNCLRVRSCYFGRSNSLEGGDDELRQRRIGCPQPDDNNLPPYPAGFVSPAISNIEYFQTGNTSENVCSEDGCGAYLAITQGITLRRMGHEVFTNFKDLFKNVDAIHNIGVGYSSLEPNVVRIEPKEFFYNNTVALILDIDEIASEFEISIDSEHVYKKIECGYEELKNDDVRYLDAFNTPRNYNLPSKISNSTLEIQSKFLSEGTAIEIQRQSIDVAEAPFDTNIICVCVGRSTDVNAVENMFKVETGVDNPTVVPNATNLLINTVPGFFDPSTVYNFRISPYYNILRWLSYIKISLYKTANKTIKFAKGVFNYEVGGNEPAGYLCNLEGQPPAYNHFENSDINLSTIDNIRFGTNTGRRALFSPEIATFKLAISLEQFMQIEQNPNGKIIVNGIPYYLDKLTYKINGISTFTLRKQDDSI